MDDPIALDDPGGTTTPLAAATSPQPHLAGPSDLAVFEVPEDIDSNHRFMDVIRMNKNRF